MNDYDQKIALLGDRIQSVDRMLVHLLARRNRLAQEVAMLKIEAGKPLFNVDREEKRLGEVGAWAAREGLNPRFAQSLLYAIIGESCKVQMGLADVKRLTGDFPERFRPSPDDLRANLLALTDQWAPKYDQDYGNGHPATLALLEFERRVIDQMVAQAPDNDLAIDLGCATGREIRRLAKRFKALRGFDVSESMVRFGRDAIAAESAGNVSLEVCDIEKGLPLEDASASVAIMNGGTGSDVRDLRALLSEIRRVLKPRGRFVLSFYNKEAWTQDVFMPWPPGLAAGVDQGRDCLEVRVGTEIIAIYAKAYSLSEIEGAMPDHLELLQSSTYPTLSAVLPPEIAIATKPEGAVQRIDDLIAQTEMGLGAYIVIAGEKV